MDSKYKFTDTASDDLDKILNYISNTLCNHQAANNLFNNIFKTIDNIVDYPLSYPLAENDLARSKNIRKAIIDNYNLYYVIENNIIWIVRIIYNKRDLSGIPNLY